MDTIPNDVKSVKGLAPELSKLEKAFNAMSHDVTFYGASVRAPNPEHQNFNLP